VDNIQQINKEQIEGKQDVRLLKIAAVIYTLIILGAGIYIGYHIHK
jgi:hypothetical protein